MKRYWIGVTARCEDGLCDYWPDGVQAWTTGWDADAVPTWCVMVDAPDEDAAMERIAELWSSYERRFGPYEKSLDWLPGDRFPGARPYDGGAS